MKKKIEEVSDKKTSTFFPLHQQHLHHTSVRLVERKAKKSIIGRQGGK